MREVQFLKPVEGLSDCTSVGNRVVLASRSMRVLAACSLGGAGHLNPLLPFLAAFRRRGDDVLVVGPHALADMVADAGYPFRPAGEPSEAEIAPIRERLAIASQREASILGNRELFARMATTAMLPVMQQVCDEWRPNVILRDPCEYSSAVVAGRRSLPTVQVAISLAATEAGSIDVAAPALEKHRVGLAQELRVSPYLTRMPASLDPSPFSRTLRFRDVGRPPSVALPDWWSGSQQPLVYVSFGTVLGHMSMAADIYRVALQALADLPVRALLTVGRKFDRTLLGTVPTNVHVEAWVDQHDVFAHASAMLCHGGSGTVFGALAAGVPMVVVPAFSDQFANGALVSASGAGLIVAAKQDSGTDIRRVVDSRDAVRMSAALTAVLGTPAFRASAQRVGSEMAAAPDIDALVTMLGNEVFPAKSSFSRP